MHLRLPFRSYALWLLACLVALPAVMPVPSRAQTLSPGGSAEPGVAEKPGSGLSAFDLLTPEEGWALAGGRLFWSHDGGGSWVEITPPLSPPLRQGGGNVAASPGQGGAYSVAAVAFPDVEHGFAALVGEDGAGWPAYALARTADGGATWEVQALSLFTPGDPAGVPGAVTLQFLDARTGWLVVKRATSANFSLGTLFATRDGGETWARLDLPIGEAVRFVDPSRGWAAGGAAGDELYQSGDGGRSWAALSLTPTLSQGERGAYYQLPVFSGERFGLLPVVTGTGTGSRVELYISEDGGASWQWVAGLAAEAETSPGVPIPVAALGEGQWLARMPGSDALLRLSAHGAVEAVSQDPSLAGIQSIDMAGASAGWALFQEGRCDLPSPVVGAANPSAATSPACRQDVRLLRTRDGGRTWEAVALTPALSQGERGEIQGLVAPMVGQGFDKCEIPTLAQLQAWIEGSPYRALNLYIGGSMRACSNKGLTADYLSQATAQGWRFIPTWVGPQAPCSSYNHRIDYDPQSAHDQGVAEATTALTTAVQLGLALPNTASTVIYYDMEAYNTTDQQCKAAVNSFISGWSEGLQQQGQIAGAYGADCGSAPKEWADVPHPPDVLWVAHWDYSFYNPDVTVFSGMICLPDSLWPQHQRVRQYAGGHNETWGSVTLNIDCDVIDGIVSDLDPPPCCRCQGPDPCWQVFLPAVLWKTKR